MTTSDQLGNQAQGTQRKSGIYVYGIVPADAQVAEDARGVGDPPGKVKVIREGDIAALISDVPTDRPLGTPEDLQAHAQLLDGTASVTPVLPLRFGAVMADVDAVATELLREHHDEFAQALNALEGHAQYIVRGRYDEQGIIAEIVSESDQASALLEDIRGKPDEASRNSQIALGEYIGNAIEYKRQVDTKVVIDVLDELATEVNVRPPTHEYDAVHVALLVQLEREPDLEAVLDRLAEHWGERVALRLLGPLAPYDFVVTS
ncbi:GvpL/GvpF family gas vesicle protein [Mycobacterium colombiense]|uniref:GvpL/GvpF family gas vesicle protein n=1 Tax=Mycobacterium colombiense TaxID=339268 RepID=UPI00096E2845|nr:GvpL/GvpF family gas vesicle protein [Mycobacterium colombiense]OMC22656.1 gas vesicle protein GvpFL [Mycobacterium colombiense]